MTEPIPTPEVAGNLSSNTTWVQAPNLHLYIVVLFAYRKDSLMADSQVISSISDTDAGALNGATEANKSIHPDAEWQGHAEYAQQVPDDLVVKVADLIRGTPGPVGSGIPAIFPEAIPVSDPLALAPPPMPYTRPDTHDIAIDPTRPSTPLNIPANPTVAYDANSIGFRV